MADAEESTLPLPHLVGEEKNFARKVRRRWVWVSLAGMAGWVFIWLVMYFGIKTGFLDKPPTWVIVTILGFGASTGFIAFPTLLVGMMQVNTTEGKIVTAVSGLHAVSVIVLVIAIFANYK